MRESSWQEGTFEARHPTIDEEQVVLSPQEYSMLQKLRSFGSGSFTVLVVRTANGRDGMHSFRITEEETEE